MNAIIFLAIASTLATVSVAKTYEEMDTSTILNEIQNIIKIPKNKNIGVREANNGEFSSIFQPLAATPYMGTGYFNYQLFSDSNCNNQALSTNVLLNTCSQTTTGTYKYTKSTASTDGKGVISLNVVSYSDSGCTVPQISLFYNEFSSGCTQGALYQSRSNDSFIVGSSATSYKISLVPTLSYPTTDRAIITT
jgi:hypothetical protein